MFHRILVPLDGSPLAEQALSVATTIAARAGGATGSLELVLVDRNASRDHTKGDAEERIYIQSVAEEASRLLGVTVGGVVVSGDAVTALVQRANETDADLIVMTTHGRTGLRRALMGSVADGVVREAGRPVLLVRPKEGVRWRSALSPAFRRILVPLDGTDEARTVVEPVLDLCRRMQARLILTRVVFPVMEMSFSDGAMPYYGIVDGEATRLAMDFAQDALIKLALTIETEGATKVETSVNVGGDVAKTLLAAIDRAKPDLLAMVTHARGGSRLLVASVADRLLRDTDLPVLLLHPRIPSRASDEAGQLIGRAYPTSGVGDSRTQRATFLRPPRRRPPGILMT